MYRYFVHSQKYSFLYVTLTGSLRWLQHKLNNGKIVEIQIYEVIQLSVIIFRHQTSVTLFCYLETQGNTIKSQLLLDSSKELFAPKQL